MRRRDVLALLGGAAALPFALPAHAQPRERVRRIGVLLPFAADDAGAQTRIAAFRQGLALLGWSIGRNVEIDIRWATANAEIRRHAAELAALASDVILANGGSSVAALLQATRTVPVVFVAVADPVDAGLVDSLARPSGNVTGFMLFDLSLSGKWLELLKQIAPGVTRVAVLQNPASPGASGQLSVLQAAAPAFGVELQPVDIREASETENSIAAFARQPNGGLVVTTSALSLIRLDLIIALASKHQLPAVYADRVFVTGGGLAAYGPDRIDQYGQAAGYVDRILKGEKPADLPVQAPTKYELVLNLKTAKALGLDVPAQLLARADEVIE